MTLTLEDIRAQQFTIVRLREGYAVKEVDDFLDDVEAALTRLRRENEALRAQLAEATRKRTQQQSRQQVAQPHPAVPPAGRAWPQAPAPAPPRPAPDAGNAARLLEMAQQVADRATETARREAEALVGEARGRAESIERAARDRAEALDRDAQDRHRTSIGALESARSVLQARIDSLHSFEQEYRTRLKSFVALQLNQLEIPADGPPAPTATPETVTPSRPSPAPLKVPVPAQLRGFHLDDDD
ncbi:DivIVA domain-containing protein [Kitasatospora indigofera]|uniref:DivIVA domain-containing protein n=1 Tax=Kitasatospora indigofera TaxID=67307 RepID=UPI00369D7DA8